MRLQFETVVVQVSEVIDACETERETICPTAEWGTRRGREVPGYAVPHGRKRLGWMQVGTRIIRNNLVGTFFAGNSGDR